VITLLYEEAYIVCPATYGVLAPRVALLMDEADKQGCFSGVLSAFTQTFSVGNLLGCWV
jgi:hypothetical protein